MSVKVVDAGSLKVGGYVIFDGIACKVTDLQRSAPGKHGHAKYRIAALGLIDGNKRVKVFPGHDKVEVPIVEKETAQVLSIKGSTATVMDMKSYETFDLSIPHDLKDQIKEGIQISYWIILKDKVMQGVR